MTIRAIRRVRGPRLNRLPVHALEKHLGNLPMAFSACSSHVPVAYAGLRIAGRQNFVRAVAIRADSSLFSLRHRLPVHALQVLLDGMRDGNFVPRKKTRIRMTPRACCGLIPFRHGGSSLARCKNVVRLPMARLARGRIRISRLRRLPVDALRKLFRFIRVTLRTLGRHDFYRWTNFMLVPMTGRTCPITQRGMNALRNSCRLIRVAGRTLHLLNLCRVRKFLNLRVAIRTTKNSVHTRCMFFRTNRNIFSLFGFHSGLAVTSQTCFVLF